jgi:hypothetical protein
MCFNVYFAKAVSEINTSNVFNKYKKIKAYYEGEHETTNFISNMYGMTFSNYSSSPDS